VRALAHLVAALGVALASAGLAGLVFGDAWGAALAGGGALTAYALVAIDDGRR
jgi:hypothetical protein